MIIGVSGQKESGKNTVCDIIRAIDLYYNHLSYFTAGHDSLEEIIWKCCREDGFGPLAHFNGIASKWEVHAYADILKKTLSCITGCRLSNLYSHKGKESLSNIKQPNSDKFYTYRQLLQLFGTEVGRVISENIWVDATLKYYNANLSNWLIPDVRFPNELKAIKDRGGLIIHCNRSDQLSDLHASERALDGFSNEFDLEIEYDPTLKTMTFEVLNFMQTHKLI